MDEYITSYRAQMLTRSEIVADLEIVAAESKRQMVRPEHITAEAFLAGMVAAAEYILDGCNPIHIVVEAGGIANSGITRSLKSKRRKRCEWL